MALLPPVVAHLIADTKEFTAKLDEAAAKMEGTQARSSAAMQKMAQVGKVAFLGIAAGAIAVGVEGIHMADKFEAAHARLESAVESSGTKMSALTKTIDAQHKSFETLGYSHDVYEGALARLTQATNSPKKALQEMGVVADIAAARHIDLEAAATLVGKVMQGNTGVLKRFGIDLGLASGGAKAVATATTALAKAQDAASVDLDKYNIAVKEHGANSKQASDAQAVYLKAQYAVDAAQKKLTATTNAGSDAVGALGKRFSGAASKQAETFGGQIKALEAKFKDFEITVGQKIIPILQDVLKYFTEFVNYLASHQDVLIALGVIVGTVLTAAFASWAVSLFATDGALAILVSPIAAIVIGLLAIAAAALWLSNHWDEAWNFISHNPAFAVLIAILTGPILLPIIGLAAAISFFRDHWKDVWGVVQSVISIASGIINGVIDVINTQIGIAAGIVNTIGDAFSTAWAIASDAVQTAWDIIRPILNAIKSAVHGVMGAINGIAGAIGSIGGAIGDVGGFIGLAEGGIVTGPTLALIGEGSGPEAVIPLDDPSRAAQLLAAGGLLTPFPQTSPGSSAAGSSGGRVDLNVILQVSTAAGHDSQAGNQILQQLMVALQRSGTAPALRQALGIPSS